MHILLTGINGCSVLINTSMIKEYLRGSSKDGEEKTAIVYLKSSVMIPDITYVQETPEEILLKIKAIN